MVVPSSEQVVDKPMGDIQPVRFKIHSVPYLISR